MDNKNLLSPDLLSLGMDPLNSQNPFESLLGGDFEGLINQVNPQQLGINDIEQCQADHFENLAFHLSEYELSRIAEEVLSKIEDDITSRADWEEFLAEGLDLLGMDEDVEGEEPFEGSSKAVSSAMLESFLSIVNTICKEVLKQTGPANMECLGNKNPELEEVCDRLKAFVNWYLTKDYKAFNDEIKKAILWSVLYGSSFVHVYKDPITGKIKFKTKNPRDFIVNANCSSWEEATTITTRSYITDKDFRMMIMRGFYRDIDITDDLADLEYDDSQLINTIKKIEGVNGDNFDRKSGRLIYSSYHDMSLKGDELFDEDGKDTGIKRPYFIEIDITSKKIVMIRRNWKEGDDTFERILDIIKLEFMKGLWFYGWGVYHLIGPLTKTATIITRQFIDANTLYNFPGGVRAKSVGRNESSEIKAGPCQFAELDLGTASSIQDVIMPFPYKEPSPVTAQLLQTLEDAIRRIAGASIIQPQDVNANMPFGSAMLIYEEKNKIISSVMGNYWQGITDMLQIFYDLCPDMLKDNAQPIKIPGSVITVRPEEFTDDFNIFSAADTDLNSDALRLLKTQELRRISMETPGQLNDRAITKMLIEQMKLNPEEFMLPDPAAQQVPSLDPISTCMNILAGQPVKAYITQDHQAYLTVLGNLQQQLMQDPMTNGQKLAALQALQQEHQVFMYQLQMENLIGQQLPDDPASLPPEIQNQIAMQAANALMQQQQQQAEQQPQPIDPNAVLMEDVKVKEKGIEIKAQTEKEKLELEKYKIDAESENMAKKLEMEKFVKETEKHMEAIQLEFELKYKQKELEIQEYKLELEKLKLELSAAKDMKEEINSEMVSG